MSDFTSSPLSQPQIDAHSAAHMAWATILDRTLGRVAAVLRRNRLSRELAHIEPRLRADAGIDPATYMRD